jgi:drug/metabolite transporter (DMT)-like permease
MIKSEIENKDYRLGILLSVFGALLLSTKGIFAKILYDNGADYESVTVVRAILSIPLFWTWYFMRRKKAIQSIPKHNLFIILSAGFIAYYFGALVNFYALTMIDANIERLILYSFPAIVIVFKSFQEKTMPSKNMVLILLVIYLGLFLAVGIGNQTLIMKNFYGGLLVFISTITVSIYFLLNEKYGQEIGSITFTTIAMTGATVGLFVHALVRNNLNWMTWSPEMWINMLMLVLVATTIPLFMVAEGIKRSGASASALGTTIAPPSTIFFAWLILGETLEATQIIGCLMVLFGIIILQRSASDRIS